MDITRIFDNCHPNFCVILFCADCVHIAQILLASCNAVSGYIFCKVPKSALPNYKSIFVCTNVFTSDEFKTSQARTYFRIVGAYM